jgi:RNA polymerase sigma-70 factor, ECF subfamily
VTARPGLDIAAARSGDRAALEAVAERAHTIALRTAIAVLGRREPASDVAQVAALAAVRRLHSLATAGAFDAWVHRIALRESVRAQRRLRVRAAAERPLESEVRVEAERSNEPWEAANLRMSVAQALQELSNRQRAAVVLRYVHDLSDEEIARALRCRVGTVHALLSRARKALRDDPAVHAFRSSPSRSAVQ